MLADGLAQYLALKGFRARDGQMRQPILLSGRTAALSLGRNFAAGASVEPACSTLVLLHLLAALLYGGCEL